MDAVMFLKEKVRMCRTVRVVNVENSNVESCENCPIELYCGVEIHNPEIAVSIVEKWAAEHPRMTNAQKFKEVFGMKPEYCRGTDTTSTWWAIPYEEPYKEQEERE